MEEGASVNLNGALAVVYFLGTMGGFYLSMLGGITPLRSSSSSLDEVSSIKGLHCGSKRLDDQFRLWKPLDFSNLVASCQLEDFLWVSSYIRYFASLHSFTDYLSSSSRLFSYNRRFWLSNHNLSTFCSLRSEVG